MNGGERISTAEAAKRIGIHKGTLSRAAKMGKVPPGVCFKVLSNYVWDLKALDAWIDASDASQQDCPAPPRRGRQTVLQSVVRR